MTLWTFIKGRLRSFGHATRGIVLAARTEHGMWIHGGFAVATLLAAWLFNVTKMEWIAIIVCVGMVIALEIMNTAIEFIVDFISPGFHEQAKHIKDLSAGAVLFAAIAAACVGLIIFIPRIIELF